jgi:hypothetical protein
LVVVVKTVTRVPLSLIETLLAIAISIRIATHEFLQVASTAQTRLARGIAAKVGAWHLR